MKKGTLNLALATAITTTALVSNPVAAYEAGDWLIRGRIIAVQPDDSSNVAMAGATALGKVGVDNDVVPEVDFTYMLTRNWGVELILASSKHKVSGKSGILDGVGDILDVRTLPPTLTLQYHFKPDSKYQPYVGIGVNYTLFFDEDESSDLEGAVGKSSADLDDSIGIAFQVGMDVAIDKDWFVNFDVKYIDMDTDASINTAALGKVKVDVDIDPWVYGIGIGRRF